MPEDPATDHVDVAAAGESEVPLHERSLSFKAYDRGESIRVAGRLRDVRPWLEGTTRHVVHDMELQVVVRKVDLLITEAVATMHAFPHAECPDIAPVFSGLVGLSIGRGYVKEVQRRFVGAAGCSHLDHLARGLGPAVIQALASSHARQMRRLSEEAPVAGSTGDDGGEASSMPRVEWLRNTCHLWADDGIGARKIDLGWTATEDEYPVPRIEVLIGRRR
jgi:hypothetical protein